VRRQDKSWVVGEAACHRTKLNKRKGTFPCPRGGEKKKSFMKKTHSGAMRHVETPTGKKEGTNKKENQYGKVNTGYFKGRWRHAGVLPMRGDSLEAREKSGNVRSVKKVPG